MAEPIRTNGGNKVGWEVYAKQADAKKRATAAKREARVKAAKGYDFGYQSPGSVRKVEDGWEVCVP
jgi:hypothetical protein